MTVVNDAEKTSDLAVRWLDPARVRARWEPQSVRLTVRIDSGDEIGDARAALAFPISCADGYVELSDSKGNPIGMLKSLAGMTSDSAAAIQAALTARYMIPCIKRVLEIREISPFVLRWNVQTDRGEISFTTESPREAVRYVGHDRIRITDLAGNHFDIPSLSDLDISSRSFLSVFL